MQTAIKTRGMVHFGEFELDAAAGQLYRKGAKLRLQEQPSQILQILLQRPGEVVTREELQQKIWPSDTFVDFDHNLDSAIARIRALGHSAGRAALYRNAASPRVQICPPSLTR